MLVPDRNRGPQMSILVRVGHNMMAYHAALYFCGSTFIFSRPRLFLRISDFAVRILRKLIFPIVKDCVFVFSAQAD